MCSTGASKGVMDFDRSRNDSNTEGESMSTMQNLSHGVRTRLTLASCRYFLKIASQQEAEVKPPSQSSVYGCQRCRPIKQIRTDPLALCD